MATTQEPQLDSAELRAPLVDSAENADAADPSLWQEDVAGSIQEKDLRPSVRPNYPVIGWLSFVHVCALAAPLCFSWEAFAATMFLYWLNGSMGVCLGYHRLLTHGAFQTSYPMRLWFAFLGGLSGEGCAIDWVANHRKHHAHSDHEGDPHSPKHGTWWSHVGWLGWSTHGEEYKAHVKRWAPDLYKDFGMRLLGHLFLPIHILSGVALLGIGYWIGGTSMAISFLVWGLFVRLVIVFHVTWLVNSASHMFGYCNYETKDDSRNNWFVAIVAFGEGWHNNHHAYPRMANQGHKWWELDPTFWVLRLLQKVGLVWNVVDYKSKSAKKDSQSSLSN